MSGQVIWQQISLSTKMACGARKAVAGADKLQFEVGATKRNHLIKIVVTLNVLDLYDVQLVDTSKKTWETTVIESLENVYDDMLSNVIYKMVNK